MRVLKSVVPIPFGLDAPRGLAALLSLGALFALGAPHDAAAAGLLTPAGATTPLSIRDQDVRVVVDDGYVVTEVEQVFVNDAAEDLEAIYTFPVPLHAAVAEFTYWIDGKPVTAEVVEKEQARAIYAAERAAGREAALAEKDRYRTFDISVYPVRARADVRIRFVYLQTAHTDLGIGRYVYPLEEGGVDEERLAFWEVRDVVTGTFSFSLELKSSYPVDAVRVPNQTGAKVEQLGPGHWHVAMASSGSAPVDFDRQIVSLEGGVPPSVSEAIRLDQDIVVYWRHEPGLPGSVDLVTYRQSGSDRGTFMLTVTPGDDLPPITTGRNWIFVLDHSGSMSGKIATLAEGVRAALGRLPSNDAFAIVTFNQSADEMTNGFVPATPENVAAWMDRLRSLEADGGTDLHSGLVRALKLLDADRPSGIVLITDGEANVGVTKKKAFVKLMQAHDVRLYTFIMGNSANVPLLEAMTEVSNGFAMTISNADDIGGQLMLATAKLSHHAMHDISLGIDGIRASDLEPVRIGSLYRGEQLVLMGHYFGGGNAHVSMSATVDGAPVRYETSFAFPEASAANPELERLWAYRQIEHLERELDLFGEDPDIETAITDLGIAYGLVTDYTSMIVVRDDIFEALGIERQNRDRVERERAAREQRSGQAPVARRVDQAQPMFATARASADSGGGAFGLEILALLVGFGFGRRLFRTDPS